MRHIVGVPLVVSVVAIFSFLTGCGPKKAPEEEPRVVKEEFDILIINGLVFDGTGRPPEAADVGILGDKIKRIGHLAGSPVKKVIDAAGLYVMPGIIDVHNHADDELLEMPDAANLVRQGITTIVTGNCGGSAYPVGEFYAKLEENGMTLNVVHLVGHNTIRRDVMGLEARAATAEELEAMKALVRRGMEEGAVGLSTGLKYTPGAWADTDEVVELAKVVAEFHGLYTSHMRDEGRGVVESVRETIEIGRRAGVPVQISHHKVTSADLWGASVQTLALVDQSWKENIPVYIDQYPYPATSTGLTVLFPAWSLEGGQSKLAERLADPEIRGKVAQGIVDNIIHDRGGGDPANIRISLCRSRPQAEGKSIADLLVEEGRPASPEEAAQIIMDIQSEGGAQAVYVCLADEDIERIMRHPKTMIATDSHICAFGEGVPHPRNYGTFPRVFRLYVKEKRTLSPAEAVKKMTSMPAQAFFLLGRGILAEEMFADVCIFDPQTIGDTATWTEPHNYPEGIDYVIVNGQIVVEDGKQLDTRPGRVLRHKPFKVK
jgi:N-acyl-D-amino-acid deacylase